MQVYLFDHSHWAYCHISALVSHDPAYEVTDNVQVKERIGVISSNSRVEDLLKCNTESKSSLCATQSLIAEKKLSNKAYLGGPSGLEVQGGKGEMCVAFDIWWPFQDSYI